jgi:hypothetical protein
MGRDDQKRKLRAQRPHDGGSVAGFERERDKREEGKKIGVENDSQRERRVPLLVPMRTRVESLQGVHLAICDNVRREASQRVGENLPTVSLCMCILRTSVSIQRGKGFQEQWG